jgi:RNA polymerase sigma-70 factor (ECF subfamily)
MTNYEGRSNPGDRDLIAALRAGDPSAFATMHARYLDRVFGYVLRRVSQREDAEDVTCAVFSAAAQSVRTFRGDASLLAWLFGVARRKVSDHMRRARRRPHSSEVEPPHEARSDFTMPEWTADLPDEALERAELADAVRRAVARLPGAQREALQRAIGRAGTRGGRNGHTAAGSGFRL